MRISPLVFLAPLLGSLACTDAATPPPSAERIPVGILLDDASDDSASIEQGALTAVRQINALGGVLGHPLEAVRIRYKSDDPTATAEIAVRAQIAATPTTFVSRRPPTTARARPAPAVTLAHSRVEAA